MHEDMKSRYIRGMPATIPYGIYRHRVSRALKYIKLQFFLLVYIWVRHLIAH